MFGIWSSNWWKYIIYLKIQKKGKIMKECNIVSYLLGMVSSALQAASFAGS